jgi:hypothetical protein
MVGAADGLGGKEIRTVSFFGWTLPVDFFIGVTGAPGTPGGSGGCGSAICFQFKINPVAKESNQIPNNLNYFSAAKAAFSGENSSQFFAPIKEKAGRRIIARPLQKVIRAKLTPFTPFTAIIAALAAAA